MKKFLKATTILMIALGMSFQVAAQTNDFSSYPTKPCKQYYLSYWTATKKTVTAPFHWKKPEWIAFGGVVAGGATLYIFDNKINNFFQAHQTAGLNRVAKYGLEPLGSGVYSFPFVAGFYFYGVATHNKKMMRVAMAATQAVIIGGVSVEVVKNIFGRVRPYQSVPANPRLWMGPTHIPNYVSFPSGHTVVAFSLATVFASAYKDKPWVGILSYGLATGVGLSRIYNDKHWSSDVLLGAALGFAVGKTAYHILEGNPHLKMGIMNDGTVGMAYHF
ncbi:MAG: phosphatase PAP2 family protein [Bacteroidales bacterium]|nr:phosphatase PAP2 family protein [Bacteroidales bacterium]